MIEVIANLYKKSDESTPDDYGTQRRNLVQILEPIYVQVYRVEGFRRQFESYDYHIQLNLPESTDPSEVSVIELQNDFGSVMLKVERINYVAQAPGYDLIYYCTEMRKTP